MSHQGHHEHPPHGEGRHGGPGPQGPGMMEAPAVMDMVMERDIKMGTVMVMEGHNDGHDQGPQGPEHHEGLGHEGGHGHGHGDGGSSGFRKFFQAISQEA